MSVFTVLSLVLLVVVMLFALANPGTVVVRFLVWQYQTTVALAVIGAAVLGGLLVFVSNALGQRGQRARLRQLQARVRELETKVHELSAAGPDQKT
jgi:putative membrane protein